MFAIICDMKRFYPYRQKWYLYAMLAALMIILLLTLVVNVMRLCEVAGMTSYNRGLDIAAIIVVAVAAIWMSLGVFGSGYYFRKDKLVSVIGMQIRVMSYDDIVWIRQCSDKQILLLYVRVEQGGNVMDPTDGSQAMLYQVQIAPAKYTEFVAQIKAKHPATVFELLPSESDKETKV